VRNLTHHVPGNRLLLKIGVLMMSKKRARSQQFQLALRRINYRRVSELSSANWSLPEGETNRRFPVKSHVNAVLPPTHDGAHSDVTKPRRDDMDLNND